MMAEHEDVSVYAGRVVVSTAVDDDDDITGLLQAAESPPRTCRQCGQDTVAFARKLVVCLTLWGTLALGLITVVVSTYQLPHGDSVDSGDSADTITGPNWLLFAGIAALIAGASGIIHLSIEHRV